MSRKSTCFRPYSLPFVVLLFVTLGSCSLRTSPDTLYSRARDQWIRADFSACREAASRAAAQFPPGSFWYWRFRLLEAESLLSQSKLKEVAPLLRDAPVGPAGALAPQRLMDLAELAMKSADLPRADTLLEQARASATDPELIRRLDLLDSALKWRQNKLGEAEAIAYRLLAEARRAHDRYNEISALVNLSALHHAQAHFDREVDLSAQALEGAEAIGARRIAASAHTNLGNALTRLGDFERARHHLEEAEKLYEAIGDSVGRINPIGNSGVIYSLQNNPWRAASAYKRAYDLARGIHNEPLMALWIANLASASFEANNLDEAETYNDLAAEIAQRQTDTRRLTFVMINRALIASRRGQMNVAIRLSHEALVRSRTDPGLQWEIHANLAQFYTKLKQPAAARAEYEAALRNIEAARSELEQLYKMTLLSRLGRFYQSYVDLLVEDGRDEKALQVAEASRARVLAERLGLPDTSAHSSPAQLKRLAASAHTVFLTYWFAPRRSFVWRITGTEIRRFTLPSSDELEPILAAHRRQIEGDPFSVAADGTRLWKILVEPVAAGIPAGSRVVIVPDGTLHKLNFETLKTPDGKFWIEDVALSVAPSLAVLSEDHPAPSTPSVLLIGAPSAANPAYPPLPKADSELAGIQSSFPKNSTVHRGARATPTAYKTAGPERFSLIHFAAHAESNAEDPLESAVILSPEGDNYKLYARDVTTIPIHADVVTISACRSAGVRAYAGEGLIGFAWAFLQAGAGNVVAGLWDASDTSTDPLMREFYKALAVGQTPVSALRSAKLTLLHGAYPKPYNWAPFQIYSRTLQR